MRPVAGALGAAAPKDAGAPRVGPGPRGGRSGVKLPGGATVITAFPAGSSSFYPTIAVPSRSRVSGGIISLACRGASVGDSVARRVGAVKDSRPVAATCSAYRKEKRPKEFISHAPRSPPARLPRDAGRAGPAAGLARARYYPRSCLPPLCLSAKRCLS